MAYHVSKAAFGQAVEAALAELPEQFAAYLEEISIEIRQRPSPRQEKSVGTTKDQLLLGLYVGRPRTERSVMDEMVYPDVIYLFQQNIEAVCDTEEELVAEVRKTVLHEIGHHFGMSEEDLDELGYG